ncbi:hypothetical protein QYE76_001018 [Lolium multiflorum]|uniref:Reverse transcriptase Ty1/copia-type domain-containing protein n=1 Tax=Lolium multiflorum TaxID=4521 RepID=A0AAD8VYY4_LOLMU|nr:hypothetical protein QYE76_001018 [Lolium multiflorum]
MLKEFISTQTAFNKSVEEKLGKIDILASKVDSLAADVDLLKLKVMPNENHNNKIATTANAIQVRINENIRLMAELRARWEKEENAKEDNIAKVWTITTTSNANAPHVAAPPTINGKRIGVSNVSTSNAKREKLPETAKTAETACDKAAEIFSNIGDDDPIALDYNGLDFDDCHISEVIKFLQKLAKSPNASAINLAFTKHITNALIKAREEKLEREASIPRKLEDGWEPIIKMKVNDFDCNALCDLGASFVVNEADKCVYYRYGGGEGVILCLYVDDILIFGTNMRVIHEVKSFLSKSFDMKDLGEADVILNIKLIKNESGITLTQSHYVEKILSRFGYIDSKSSPTPYDPSVTLRKNRRIAIDQLRYSQIVGSLMYLASATRPDISFAVSKLSRFMSNPGTDHWHALDRVMRYLCGTMSYGIHYSGHPAVLEGYSDSNWRCS